MFALVKDQLFDSNCTMKIFSGRAACYGFGQLINVKFALTFSEKGYSE